MFPVGLTGMVMHLARLGCMQFASFGFISLMFSQPADDSLRYRLSVYQPRPETEGYKGE